MYYLIYLIIFLVYCFLPLWLQIILFIISCIIAPGGNIVLIIAMIIGGFLKARTK